MTVHNPAGAIAIPIFLGTNLLMAADELDALVFGMAVDSVRALSVPFAEKVAEIAHRSLGDLLFNLRIDGDMEFQRVAAIRYPSYQTAVLVLDKQGLSTSHCMVNGTFSSFIAPLEEWNTLPLATQARTSIAGSASLFIGALRNAGYLPRGRH
ncbi:hypothetical protein NKI88_27660 [Mesorhizobium sp. M0317]|uniref:hypothetical protein n=1 Tax=Mesorhizobium sp. M0317 TaxID=2956935 RepID=UPI00333B80D8